MTVKELKSMNNKFVVKKINELIDKLAFLELERTRPTLAEAYVKREHIGSNSHSETAAVLIKTHIDNINKDFMSGLPTKTKVLKKSDILLADYKPEDDELEDYNIAVALIGKISEIHKDDKLVQANLLKTKASAISIIRKLKRDGSDKEDFGLVFKELEYNEFWRRQVKSLNGLTKISANGYTKFANLLTDLSLTKSRTGSTSIKREMDRFKMNQLKTR